MEQNSESSIIQRARLGDQEAIGRLYENTKNYAYFVTRRYLQNDEDIADVLQDAYVSVFSNLGKFEDSKPFKPWLHAIVTNKCLTFIKSKRAIFVSQDEIGELASDNEELMPPAWLERAEKRRDVIRIIDGLPEGQRMAVTLFYFEGLSISEMAGVMGVAEGTVKAHLYYGRKTIKEEVLREEKKGNKLYAIVPLPLLTQLFELEAEAAVMPEAISKAVWEGTINSLAANGVIAGANTTASGAVANGAGTSTATGLAGKIAAMNVTAKIIAAVMIAAVTTVGLIVGITLSWPAAPVIPAMDTEPSVSTAVNVTADAVTTGGEIETSGLAVPDADTAAAHEYYARELESFLDSGQRGYSVMLKDIDRDGVEELVTYWEDHVTVPDEFYGDSNERVYRLDIYDWDGGEELHFTQEKSDTYGFAWDETIYLSGTGNLAFYSHYSDISPQPGWVYDHSQMHSIKGGLYTPNWNEDAEFKEDTITESRLIELCEEYGLEPYRFRWEDSDGMRIVEPMYQTPLFPYADTQNDIQRLLPDYVIPLGELAPGEYAVVLDKTAELKDGDIVRVFTQNGEYAQVPIKEIDPAGGSYGGRTIPTHANPIVIMEEDGIAAFQVQHSLNAAVDESKNHSVQGIVDGGGSLEVATGVSPDPVLIVRYTLPPHPVIFVLENGDWRADVTIDELLELEEKYPDSLIFLITHITGTYRTRQDAGYTMHDKDYMIDVIRVWVR